jgi:hypothetical protein
MSQQTNAGFSAGRAPGFSVVADDPAGASPSTSPTFCGSGLPVSCGLVVSPRAPSTAVGVGQQAIANFAASAGDGFRPAAKDSLRTFSLAVGVDQIAAIACARIDTSPAELPASLLPSFAGAKLVGVAQSAISLGDDPQAISTVRPIDGTSRDNGRPAGVVDAFQVSEHSVEPILANRCRNLLSHPDSGPPGTEQAKLVGPQMPVISVSGAFTSDAERLARTRAGPQLALFGPAGEPGSERPPSDPCKEMALRVSA